MKASQSHLSQLRYFPAQQISPINQSITIEQLKSENEQLKRQLEILMNHSIMQQHHLPLNNISKTVVNQPKRRESQNIKGPLCRDNAEECYRNKMEKLKTKQVLRRSLSHQQRSMSNQRNTSYQKYKKNNNMPEKINIQTENVKKLMHSPPMSPKSILSSQNGSHTVIQVPTISNQSQKTILTSVVDPRIQPMILSKDKNGRIYREKALQSTIFKHKKNDSAETFPQNKEIQSTQILSEKNFEKVKITEIAPQKISPAIYKRNSPKKCSELKSNVYFDHIELQDMQKQAQKMVIRLHNGRQIPQIQLNKTKCFGGNEKKDTQGHLSPPLLIKKYSNFPSDGASETEDSIMLQIKQVRRTGKKKLNYQIYLLQEEESVSKPSNQ